MFPNTTFAGAGPADLNFNHKVNLLHIGVQGSSIDISLDGGQNYMTLPAGNHSLNIGIITKMLVGGTGTWQITGSFHFPEVII